MKITFSETTNKKGWGIDEIDEFGKNTESEEGIGGGIDDFGEEDLEPKKEEQPDNDWNEEDNLE